MATDQTTTPPEIAALVKELSKVQRACLLGGSDIGGCAGNRTTATALVDRGLATFFRGMRGTVIDWTPLGLSVQSALRAAKEEARG